MGATWSNNLGNFVRILWAHWRTMNPPLTQFPNDICLSTFAQTLRKQKAEMVAAQRAMIASMRQQQAAATSAGRTGSVADSPAAAALAAGIDPRDLGYGGVHGGYEYN